MLSKAYKMLGFINRNTQQFNNPTTIITIYCSLVRSVREYASLIYSRSLTTHIHDLDNIQLNCLKRISHMKDLPISKDSIMPVKHLVNIDSLQLRRLLFDMFVYDLLNYNIVSPGLTQVNFPHTNREFIISLLFHSSSPNQVMTHSLLEL